MSDRFTLLQVPKVLFGAGTLSQLADSLIGRQPLLIISPSAEGHLSVQELFHLCRNHHISLRMEHLSGEPGVRTIDAITDRHLDSGVDMVVGIGGGSVLDSAKAVSVMLYHRRNKELRDLSVKNYLEGVGDRPAPEGRLPLFLIPTTAGTGSEATKNAVISQVGEGGFKKSLRHDSYVCDLAILDPSLLESAPLSVLIPSGMDALTQLLEAYFSVSTNQYIESLVLQALKEMPYALMGLIEGTGEREDHLAVLSYGAFISGVGLAHAGLGYVHGLSGPMGAMHDIPHGIACALLIAKTNRAMFNRAVKEDNADEYLSRLHRLAQSWNLTNQEQAIELLERLEELASLPSASSFGFTLSEIDTLDLIKSKRNAPVEINPEELKEILHSIL